MANEKSLNGLCAGKHLYILGEMHILNQCQTSVASQENMLFWVRICGWYIQHSIDTYFTCIAFGISFYIRLEKHIYDLSYVAHLDGEDGGAQF